MDAPSSRAADYAYAIRRDTLVPLLVTRPGPPHLPPPAAGGEIAEAEIPRGARGETTSYVHTQSRARRGSTLMTRARSVDTLMTGARGKVPYNISRRRDMVRISLTASTRGS